MILDDKSIEQLTRKGVKIVNSKGEPVRVKHAIIPLEKEDPEIAHLRRIESLLEAMLSRPQQQFPSIPTPEITVQPPKVVVQPPAPNTPKKWSFKVVRDYQGYTKEIIATALE